MLTSEILKSLSIIARNLDPVTIAGLSLTHVHQGPSTSPLTWIGSGQIYDITCYCAVTGANDIRTFYLLVDSKLIPFQKFHASDNQPNIGSVESFNANGYILLGDFSFTTDIQVVGVDNVSANCNVGFHARIIS